MRTATNPKLDPTSYMRLSITEKAVVRALAEQLVPGSWARGVVTLSAVPAGEGFDVTMEVYRVNENGDRYLEPGTKDVAVETITKWALRVPKCLV